MGGWRRSPAQPAPYLVAVVRIYPCY